MPSYQAPDTGLSILEPPDSIPAYFGHPGLGMQNDESTIELRRNMLRTRCAYCFGQLNCLPTQAGRDRDIAAAASFKRWGMGQAQYSSLSSCRVQDI